MWDQHNVRVQFAIKFYLYDIYVLSSKKVNKVQ